MPHLAREVDGRQHEACRVCLQDALAEEEALQEHERCERHFPRQTQLLHEHRHLAAVEVQ